MKNDEFWMQQALELAVKAGERGEVPVGAMIVADDKCIGEGFNQPIENNDPTAHAEIQALRAAGKHLENYRLPRTTLYVTLEPCVMCAGAIIHARVSRVVYAAEDSKSGAAGSCLNILKTGFLNHQCEVSFGVLAGESRKLLQDFFREKRTR